MNTLFRKPRSFVLTAIVVLAFAVLVNASASILEIEIKIAKEKFKAGELVTGTIRIDSFIPATYQAAFRIKLYKDDLLINELVTSTPIFLGENEYELKNFGIPDINRESQDQGRWRILISQEGNPPVAAEAEFLVEADQKTKKSSRQAQGQE